MLFGCRTGSPARSPLAFVLGSSLLPGALGQAGVPQQGAVKRAEPASGKDFVRVWRRKQGISTYGKMFL